MKIPGVNLVNRPSLVIAALNVDWSLSELYTKSISATTTLTFSNVTSGNVISVIITNSSGSAQIVNFPAGIKWSGGSAITSVPANRSNVYTFEHDGTATYAAVVEDEG